MKTKYLLGLVIFSFMVVIGGGATYAFPLYTPGQTLTPNCLPSNSDCTIQLYGASDVQSAINAKISASVTSDASSIDKYPSVKAIKDYTDSLVAGLLNYRGAYDASVNTYPATGGSGTSGAIKKGDAWVLSVAGTLGGVSEVVGNTIIANTDTPDQTASNWNTLNTNMGYVPENSANKVTSLSGSSIDTQYPSAKLLYDQLVLKQNTLDNTNLKTVNGNSLLGSGDVTISGGSSILGLTSDGANGINVTGNVAAGNMLSVLTGQIARKYPVAVGTGYNAFPGLVKLTNGTLLTVYRKGTTHASDVGIIVKRTSIDQGRTWSAESTVYSDGTYDSRDPNITLLANGSLLVDFFKYQLSPYVAETFTILSTDGGTTWSTPVAAHDLAYSTAESGPVVQLNTGELLLPVYTKVLAGDKTSVVIMRSTDLGVTWTVGAMVANGQTDVKNYTEPNLKILPNGSVMCLIRSTTDSMIALSTSTDGGVTWSAPSSKFSGIGAPRILLTAAGTLVVSTRSSQYGTISLNSPYVMRVSTDNGVTWTSDAKEVLQDYDPSWPAMGYATSLELSPGLIGTVWCADDTITNAKCWFGYESEQRLLNGTTLDLAGVKVSGDAFVRGNLVQAKMKGDLTDVIHIISSAGVEVATINTATGATTLVPVSSALATSLIYPASDSTTAIKITNAAGTGTALMTFDTTNKAVTIGGVTPTPTIGMTILHATQAAPASGGTASGNFGIVESTGKYGLYFGILAPGTSWIQATRQDGTASYYSLLMQYTGGNTAFGNSTIPVAKVEVMGTLRANAISLKAGVEGGCLAATDLVIDGTLTSKATSAAHSFVAGDVDQVMNISAGTGFTVGTYQIISVASGAATFDRALGTLGSTGGTYQLGRGRIVTFFGTTGVTDTARICRKDASDVYAWTALY